MRESANWLLMIWTQAASSGDDIEFLLIQVILLCQIPVEVCITS